ncbi:unnamed protein product, partial [Didymodactylos carnosus]
MYSLGLDVAMPPFLDGQKQFSTAQANRSQCITKLIQQHNLSRVSAWENVDSVSLFSTFPLLSEEEIGDITL